MKFFFSETFNYLYFFSKMEIKNSIYQKDEIKLLFQGRVNRLQFCNFPPLGELNGFKYLEKYLIFFVC